MTNLQPFIFSLVVPIFVHFSNLNRRHDLLLHDPRALALLCLKYLRLVAVHVVLGARNDAL